MTSERDFLRTLQQRFPARPPVDVGIGDDGAVLSTPHGDAVIVVTDMLLDQIHFDLRQTSPQMAGRKAIAVNLSDLAGMACWPTAAFVSLAIPKSLTDRDRFLDQLYDGMEELANAWNFTIAGGDTNAWDSPFAINVCMTGVPVAHSPVLRSGAKSGDRLAVTGPLGGSLKSLRHLTFEPRLNLAKELATNFSLHAMMDISDGLSIDLHRMMEASGTGALIELDQIPVQPNVKAETKRDAGILRALQDGEDFELLLSIPADVATDPGFRTLLSKTGGCIIGSVNDRSGICTQRDLSGQIHLMPCAGWQHL